MRWKKFFHPDILIGIFLLILLTLPFVLTDLDLTLAQWFYQNGWSFENQPIWDWFYRFGTWPALFLSALALIIWLGSWIWPQLSKKRRAAALILLTLILGPGFLINTVGKGYCGRNRPRDVTQFNGSAKFQRVIQFGIPGRGKSFPCGHASMGYLFMSFYFILQSRKWRWTWLGLGSAYGTLMGIGRMAQGAHFASDILWAGGLTYLSAAVIHHVVLIEPDLLAHEPARPARRKWLAMTSLGIGLAILVGFFLLATPFYKTWAGKEIGPANLKAVQLKLMPGQEEIHIIHQQQAEALHIQAEVRGFGLPSPNLKGDLHSEVHGGVLTASVNLSLDRLVTERTGTITFFLRRDLYLWLDTESADTDIRIGEQNLPAYYGRLRIVSRKGGILLKCPPGSHIIGPINLSTLSGDIRLIFNEIKDPGNSIWRAGADKGILLIEADQKQPPTRTLKLKAWSRWGDVAFKGNIGSNCGLNLQWKENQGHSGLQINGPWNYDINRLSGPVGVKQPRFEMFLGTVQGLIGIELYAGTGPKLTPTLLPKLSETGVPLIGSQLTEASAEEAEPLPTATPFPTPEPPAWIEQELIALPFETQGQ